MARAGVAAERVEPGDGRARVLEHILPATQQQLHDRDVGHGVQRSDLDAALAADCHLPLRAGQRFLGPALARKPPAAGELQAGSLACGPLGALEPRGFGDRASPSRPRSRNARPARRRRPARRSSADRRLAPGTRRRRAPRHRSFRAGTNTGRACRSRARTAPRLRWHRRRRRAGATPGSARGPPPNGARTTTHCTTRRPAQRPAPGCRWPLPIRSPRAGCRARPWRPRRLPVARQRQSSSSYGSSNARTLARDGARSLASRRLRRAARAAYARVVSSIR